MDRLRMVVVAAVLCGVSSLLLGEAPKLTALNGVALDASGNLAVTCGPSNSVVLMTRGGEQVAEFGANRLQNPTGIAIDGKGNFVVASTGKKPELLILDSKGGVLASGAGVANPQAVAVGPQGLIFVADPDNNRIAVYKAEGSELKRVFVVDKVDTGNPATCTLKTPLGVAVAGDKLAISDTGNSRVLLIPLPTEAGMELKPTIITRLGMWPQGLTAAKDGRLYVIDGGGVRGYTPEGKDFGLFAGKNSGGFSPSAIAIDAKGDLLISDRANSRVVVAPPELADAWPKLTLDKTDPTTATIEWTSMTPVPTILRYGPTEDCELESKDNTATTTHKVVLKGLKPATRYQYAMYQATPTVPVGAPPRKREECALEVQFQGCKLVEKGFSGQYPFATMPEPGKIDWVAAPTVVLIYKNLKFGPDPKTGKTPENRILDDDDIQTLKEEMETYRLWAWRHSHCKVNFDWTYVIVEEPTDNAGRGGPTPELVNDIRAGLKAQGKDINQFWYTIVCGTAGWYACYLAGPVGDPPTELGTCYTGFGHKTQHGWWWFPTHEHGHLVHSWVMCSGITAGTDKFFGFPDAPWGLPGKFGEDFSFLAYNYQQIPERAWLCLKRGVIHQSVDANGNGVPDDDPRVPLDEKRFGWTKEMGGDCMKRLMAGTRTPGFPGDSFTDFEGRKHKLVEGELFWVNRNIRKASPAMDGSFDEQAWTEASCVPALFTPKEAAGLQAKLYMAWDEKYYYFCIKSNKPVGVGAHLDAANDGWFHGRDNLLFGFSPATETSPTATAGTTGIWDFKNNTMNLHNNELWYRDPYKPGDILAASGQKDGWYYVMAAVPARPDCGIQPKVNGQFAFRVNLGPTVAGAFPGVSFWDGEEFAYDFTCVEK